jgi:hypothetical protein
MREKCGYCRTDCGKGGVILLHKKMFECGLVRLLKTRGREAIIHQNGLPNPRPYFDFF